VNPAGEAHEITDRSPRGWRQGLLPWLLPIAILVAWELSALFGWLSTRILPEPLAVLKAGWTLALSGELWTHIRVSAGRALAGFAIGGGLGLVLGLLTGSFRKMEIALDTTCR
jgi:sulfonate transport system permease protein